jgi:hypothetical protein
MKLETVRTIRKYLTFLIAVAVVWSCLERGVNHLYSLPTAAVNTYGAMFLAVVSVIGAMACFVIGMKAQAPQSTIQSAISAATNILDETKTVHVPKSAHFDGDDIP